VRLVSKHRLAADPVEIARAGIQRTFVTATSKRHEQASWLVSSARSCRRSGI